MTASRRGGALPAQPQQVQVCAHFSAGFSEIRFDLAADQVEVERKWREFRGSASGPLDADRRALLLESARQVQPALQARIREDFYAWHDEEVAVLGPAGEVRIKNERGSLSEVPCLRSIVALAQELLGELLPVPPPE